LCPGLPEWMFVGDHEMPIGGAVQRCWWSHPTSNGVVRVRWPSVDLGKGAVFSHALSDPAAANPTGAPVTATIVVAGSAVARASTTPGRAGFTSVNVPPGGSDVELVVEVTTPDDGQRHYCFRLEPGR
jgi:hypothetical protein